MLKILYCLIFSCSPFVQPFEFKVKVSTSAASEWFHLKLNVVIYRTKISKESCLCIYLLMRHCHVFLSAKSLLPTALPPQTPNLTSTTAANQPSSPAGATGAFQVNPLPSSSSSHERRDKHSRRRRGERKGESRVKDKVK